jgi:gliding motility-associated-like protein
MDQYVLDGDIVTLNGSGGGLYSWSPADSLTGPNNIADPKLLAKQNILFTLTVMDSTQTCSSTDNVMIFVERPIIIVNTFSPNGDGVNDGWVIRNIESFPKCLVKIYNRWGSLVWKSDGYPNPWDGTNMYNDQVLPDGTYFYIIELNSTIFKNPYQGWVQIVR